MANFSYPGDTQFGNLIQAATAAGTLQQPDSDPQTQITSQGDAQHFAQNPSILGKRARSEDESVIDTQLRAQSQQTSNGTGLGSPPNKKTQPSDDVASILYREPSANSDKYSRPVLKNVFKQLQIASENYVRLCSAIKDYMLDENHMERRNVIGQKKDSNDTDAAKLRLYGIVQQFMAEDNNGERFFGVNASAGIKDAPERTFFWPENSHEVYVRNMPLFRKMITNERQRIYAQTTRKSKGGKGKKKSRNQTPTPPASALSSAAEAPVEQHVTVDRSLSDTATSDVAHQPQGHTDQQAASIRSLQDVVIHINIISDDPNTHHRLKPKLSVLSQSVMTLSELVAEVNNKCGLNLPVGTFGNDDIDTPMVKALLPDGLIRVKNDEQWVVALVTASMIDWMDAELKVVLEINPVMAL